MTDLIEKLEKDATSSSEGASLLPTREEEKAILLDEVWNYSRTPFMRILADFLCCAPDPEAIKEFANKSPDRWAQALLLVGKMAGYHEKLLVEKNVVHQIHMLGDSELEERLAELEKEMGANAPILDLEVSYADE